MKKIIITENELIRIMKKLLVNINEQSEFSLRPFSHEYPRETGVKSIFGKYTEQVPNDVIRYIRKNPKLIFERLFFEYGDKSYDYLDMAKDKYTKGS